jgi:hypothetical protein
LGQAWRAISTSSIAGLLDSIRNRLLNFVIDIESIAPDVAESSSLPPSLTPQLIGNIYNMNITGNVGNLATGSSQFSQDATNTISTGDWTGLKQYLTSLGVTESDLDELKLAIDQEPSVTSPLGFGSKVAGWLGGMVTKSAQGLFEFGSAVAADLISRALAQYYGLP